MLWGTIVKFLCGFSLLVCCYSLTWHDLPSHSIFNGTSAGLKIPGHRSTYGNPSRTVFVTVTLFTIIRWLLPHPRRVFTVYTHVQRVWRMKRNWRKFTSNYLQPNPETLSEIRNSHCKMNLCVPTERYVNLIQWTIHRHTATFDEANPAESLTVSNSFPYLLVYGSNRLVCMPMPLVISPNARVHCLPIEITEWAGHWRNWATDIRATE